MRRARSRWGCTAAANVIDMSSQGPASVRIRRRCTSGLPPYATQLYVLLTSCGFAGIVISVIVRPKIPLALPWSASCSVPQDAPQRHHRIELRARTRDALKADVVRGQVTRTPPRAAQSANANSRRDSRSSAVPPSFPGRGAACLYAVDVKVAGQAHPRLLARAECPQRVCRAQSAPRTRVDVGSSPACSLGPGPRAEARAPCSLGRFRLRPPHPLHPRSAASLRQRSRRTRFHSTALRGKACPAYVTVRCACVHGRT
ncbi:hypothetical protein GY45DRAFT_140073 [Cubamyces sp. BRFM 1775]|nr:hypothetical protein GY45DRAFT_140073 [Cubamyces sp. BRFM 1775]